MTKTRFSILATALLAVAAVGCSDGPSRLSPIGPSPVTETPATTAAGTAATWASAHGWSTMADGRVAVADGVLVEAVDVVGSVSGACPSRTITVRGVAVSMTPTTEFVAPLSCASLEPGQPIKVTGLLMHASGGFSVIATQLAPVGGQGQRAPSTTAGGERLAGAGVIDAVSGSCPSKTFVVMGHRVHTTAATIYENGSCESLRDGMHVALDVLKRDDGMIAAEKVRF